MGAFSVISQTKPSEAKIATASATIADFIIGDNPLRVTITRADGERLEAQLTSSTMRALADFLREREREERKEVLQELARYSEEIGLYEMEGE
jgi:hypothetical protein